MDGNNKASAYTNNSARAGRLPRRAIQAVGEKLQTAYGDVTEQPVPAHLLDLLQKLDDRSGDRDRDRDRPGRAKNDSGELSV